MSRYAPKFAAVLGAALLVSAPAAATSPEDEITAKLNDPAFLDAMGETAAAMTGAMMELPVGEMAAAMAKALPEGAARASDIPRDARLGDMLAEKDPDYRRKLEDNARAMPHMLGAMAGVMAAWLPELRRMGDRMREAMEKRE